MRAPIMATARSTLFRDSRCSLAMDTYPWTGYRRAFSTCLRSRASPSCVKLADLISSRVKAAASAKRRALSLADMSNITECESLPDLEPDAHTLTLRRMSRSHSENSGSQKRSIVSSSRACAGSPKKPTTRYLSICSRTVASTLERGTIQPSPRLPGGRCHMPMVNTCPSEIRQPIRAVASSDLAQSRNRTTSSPGSTTRDGSASGSNSAGSVQASSAATIWLYHLRLDSETGLAGFRIDFRIRPPASSQIESPRTASTTSAASAAFNGAFGGASRESYSRPNSRFVASSPCVDSQASRCRWPTESSPGR